MPSYLVQYKARSGKTGARMISQRRIFAKSPREAVKVLNSEVENDGIVNVWQLVMTSQAPKKTSLKMVTDD